MYCKKCGNKLQSDDLFCPKCGNVIDDEDRIKAENGVSETFDEFRNRENSFAPKVEEPEDEDLTKIYATAGMMEESAPEEEAHIADGYDEILERDRLKRKIEEAESRYTDTSERYSYDDDYSEDGDDEDEEEEEEKPVKKKKAKKKLTEEEKNKKNKKIIVAVFLICLAVIVLTIGIIAIVMHNNNSKKAAETSETSVTEVETTKKVKETTKYNETTRKETTVPETTVETTAQTSAETTPEATTPEVTTVPETTSDVPVVQPDKPMSGTGKVAIPAGEGDQLNVREAPWGATVISTIPNGSTVTLAGSDASGNWYYVTFNGQTGWVLASYLQTN